LQLRFIRTENCCWSSYHIAFVSDAITDKNRYFNGADDVPAPGDGIALLICGRMTSKLVSWSLLSFCPLTVIRSIVPAAVWALVRLDDNAKTGVSAAVSAETPKS
jgi:hypothetical protein